MVGDKEDSEAEPVWNMQECPWELESSRGGPKLVLGTGLSLQGLSFMEGMMSLGTVLAGGLDFRGLSAKPDPQTRPTLVFKERITALQ